MPQPLQDLVDGFTLLGYVVATACAMWLLFHIFIILKNKGTDIIEKFFKSKNDEES